MIKIDILKDGEKFKFEQKEHPIHFSELKARWCGEIKDIVIAKIGGSQYIKDWL